MDTLSSFINKRVKSIDTLTITKLIEKCDMSKAKFYRCLSEPYRFTDTNLETIARELRLSENDKRTLFEYRESSDSSPATQTAADKSSINRVIEDITLGRIKFDTYHHDRIFKLFHSGDKDTGLQLCSAQELIDKLLPLLSTENNDTEKLTFDALIFNSYSEDATRNLSTLICALRESQFQASHYNTNYNISCFHFINDHELESDSRFEALSGLYQVASVSTFCRYSIMFADLHEAFLGNTDSCLIHFQNANHQDCYFLINFIRENEVSVYGFTDCNLYNYLSYQYTSLKKKLTPRSPRKLNSFEINNYIVEQNKSYPSLLLTYGPCFDNFLPKLWTGVRERHIHSSAFRENIRQQADPVASLSDLPIDYLADRLIESFRDRFHISGENKRTTILSSVGLKRFIDTKTTSELEPVGIYFTDQEILQQLHYFQDNLGNDAPNQSYYLINEYYSPPDTAFVVFDRSDIGVYFHDNRYSSIYWVILQQPEIASEFYRYLALDLTDEKVRNQHRPILLSDERAKSYIDMLIDQVEKRMSRKVES